MSYDGLDDPYFNPYAETQPSATNISPSKYHSSAHFPSFSDKGPTLRRRRSSLTSRSIDDGNGNEFTKSRHARARTEMQITPHSSVVHPLKSSLASANSPMFPDLGITRPHLSRIVNDGSLLDASDLTEISPVCVTPGFSDQEKDVIVHRVLSTDSLAGVALKYGISLTNLRRANKLWINDPIHLRDVLYIPIEQASRAREYVPEPLLMSFTPDAVEWSSDPFDNVSPEAAIMNSRIPQVVVPGPTVPVRRIPTKQLSYFPPSTNKNTDPDASSRVASPIKHFQSSGNSKTPPRYNGYSPSPVNNPLSSILTALPIAASTRDEIITRLSFDSVSSSFSDRSRVNSDEEVGHELDDVAKPRRSHSSADILDGSSIPTPKATQHPPDTLLRSRAEPALPLSSPLPLNSRILPYSSTSPPHFYVPQVKETYVRTSQMEPSPSMHLPNFQGDSLGRSLGKSTSTLVNAHPIL